MKKFYASLFTCVTLFFSFSSLSFAATSSSDNVSLAYLHGSASNDYSSVVDRTNQTFNQVSPLYFGVNGNGTLDIKSIDPNFINHMHSNSIKVIPRFTNGWTQSLGEKALANSDAITTQLADAINQNNLDGVNVDLENLADTDESALVHFVSLLKQKLPNKDISVAVAANPKNWTKGWQASYDYAGLAQVSDYLVLMAYDESNTGTAPGPVAGFPYIRDSVTYALNHGVPKDKLVVGLPLYGRMWNSDRTVDGLAVYSVDNILQTFHPTITYLADQQTAVATFKVPVGSLFKLYSWADPLIPGNYTLYYENEQSLLSKLNFIHTLGLRGAAVWSIGLEDSSIWSYYKNGLSSNSTANSGTNQTDSGAYSDVNADYWAYQPITQAKQLGLMTGVTPTQFEPDRALTRAEAASVLVRALHLKQAFSLPYFNDVPENYWAYSAIQTAYQHGLFRRDGSGNFDPNQKMTREAMAYALHSLIGGTPTIKNPFTDVSPSDWAYNSILSMKQQGVFMGHSPTRFGPLDPLTRAQTAALFIRLHSEHLGGL